MQSVFFNWIEGLEWVIEHGKNITLADIKRSSESLSHGEIRDGNFLHIIYVIEWLRSEKHFNLSKS
jgi:hypothetical protein